VLGTVLNIENDEKLQQAYNTISNQLLEWRPDAEFRGVLIETMHKAENTRNLAISLSRDASFGPVISVGVGGDLSTLVQQRAAQLPPLNNFLIDTMLATPTIANYLGEFRHQQPVGTKSAAHVLRAHTMPLPSKFKWSLNAQKHEKNMIT